MTLAFTLVADLAIPGEYSAQRGMPRDEKVKGSIPFLGSTHRASNGSPGRSLAISTTQA